MNIPTPGEVFAALFTSAAPAEPAEITTGHCAGMTEPEAEAEP